MLASVVPARASARQVPIDTAAVIAAALTAFHEPSWAIVEIVQSLSCRRGNCPGPTQDRRSAAADTVIRRFARERRLTVVSSEQPIPECTRRSERASRGGGFRLRVSAPETHDGVVSVGITHTCVASHIPRRVFIGSICYKVEIVDGAWRVAGVLLRGAT